MTKAAVTVDGTPALLSGVAANESAGSDPSHW
jgi:hypothetical protein